METIKQRKKDIEKIDKYVVEPSFPREIFIDLTSFCNHSCVFCSNHKVKNKHTMHPDMVRRVLKEAYECGVRDIGIYATGESFLVKELPDYIKEAKKIGFEYVFITTNGSLVTPERAKAVLDAGLDSIKFSINAGSRESYRKVHGKDDFDTVLNNLKWVSNYRKQSGLQYRIYVTMVYTNITKNEHDLLRNLVLPYIDEWDPHLLTNQCGNMYENNEIGEIEKNNVRGRVKSDVCFQPFKGFTVTPEGYITACVLDYQRDLIVADLNKETMKAAWTNDIYKKFRQKHISHDLIKTPCYNCLDNTNEEVVPLMPEYAAHFEKKGNR